MKRTVDAAPALCAPGATVIWTRHRRPPDLSAMLRSRFAANGFDEVAFDALDTQTLIGVGVHRLRQARPLAPPAGPLFAFSESAR